MSEIINSAVIKVAVDADGVEAGLRKIDEASAKTARTVEGLGRVDGFKQIGEGAEAAASKVDRTTKGFADSIQRATAAMQSGAKGSAEYFAALANSRGANMATLKPYLDQLDEVTKKTALAAQAQKQLDESTRFLDGLRGQAEGIGKTASELAALRAAQLGVSESAQPFIDQLRASEEASGGLLDQLGLTTEGLKAFAAGLVGGLSIGTFVAGVNGAIGVLAELDDVSQKTGSSVENLSRLQKVAAMVGQDFGSVDAAVAKLAKGMGGLDEDSNKVLGALKRLGVSSKDAAGDLRDPSEVLVEAAKNLQGYADNAGKTALINDLLGKSGADLLPYLNDVAESVDDFAGASGAAAADASALGDGLGLLRVKADEFYGSVATMVLPALTDLVGAFGDAAKEQDGLLDAGASEWADNLAVGLARVADVAILIPRILSTVAGSIKSVVADVSLVQTVAANANPLNAARKYFNGGSAADDIKTALAERNKVVEEANKKLDDLWNKPADQISQSMLKRLAERTSSFADPLGDKFMEAVDGYGKKVLSGGSTEQDSTKRAAAIQKEADAYGNLSASINERIAATAREAAGLAPLTESQKLQVSLDEQIKAGKLTLTAAHKAAYEQKIAELGVNEEVIASQKRAAQGAAEWVKLQKELADGAARSVADAIAEAEKNEELARTYGMSKGEIAALTLARLEDQLAQRSAVGMTLDEIEKLEKLIDAKKRSRTALATVDAGEISKKAADDLAKFLDPAKAESFGDALRGAFDGAGDSLVKLTSALQSYGTRQADIDKARRNAAIAYKDDSVGLARATAEIAKEDTKSQVRGYGDMTAAAAGFFDEQSKGYKALQAASQVFHTAELAMTLAELVPKGISAILSQGSGDPYSAFPRMAAMAAIVAGLGVAVGGSLSGSAGGQSAETVQKAQGAGSVFGDVNAKSESISRALDLIEGNTYQGLDYSAGMLESLRSIESAMGGLNNLIVRTNGVTDGSNFGIQVGEIGVNNAALGLGAGGGAALGMLLGGPLGAALGSVLGTAVGKLWGGTKTNIVDSGIQFGGSVNDLQSGIGFDQYASVDTTKKKLFGLVKKTTNSVQTQDLDADLASQFGLIFTGLEDTLRSAAVGLGINADDVSKSLDGLVLSTTTLSLKDLKGDDLTAALNAVISKAMDEISEAAFPSFDEFRKVGEGYAETVVRIAQDFAAIDTVFGSFGKTFGQIGLESIGARERLIDLAGGLQEFTSKGEFFLKNFFTEGEQAAALKARINPTLQGFGLTTEGDGATKAFKDYVVALDTTTAAGANAYNMLMKIAPAFTEIVKAGSAIVDQRKDLQNQLDDLLMSPAQLLAKARGQVDPSNAGLFDQVQTAQTAKAAAEALTSANLAYQEQIDSLLNSRMSASELRAAETRTMDASTVALYDRLAALKAEDKLTATNNSYQAQIDDLLKSQMGASELRDFETKGMAASTVALYDRVNALKRDIESSKASADAAIAAAKVRADSLQSFGNALANSMTNATAAAKSLREFNESLLLGNLSALDPDERYREAKKQFETAAPTDTAAATAFLEASKARDADNVYYQRDFAAVQAKIAAGAAEKDSLAASIPAFWKAYLDSQKAPVVAKPAMVASLMPSSSAGSSSGSSSGTAALEKKLDELGDKLEKALSPIATNTQQTSQILDLVTEGGSNMVNK